MNCSMPGSSALHYLLEFAQIHVYWVSDAIQPSLPLPLLSPAFNLSQHQGLFQWIASSHQVAQVLMMRTKFIFLGSLPLAWDTQIWDWVQFQFSLNGYGQLLWASGCFSFFLKISSRWFLYAVQIENMGLQNVLKLKSSALDPDFSSTNDKQSSTPLRHSYPMCEMKTKISALKKIDPKDLTGFCVN